MLQPSIHTDVHSVISKQRIRGKVYYDRNAHQLPALKSGQTVRMQTARGFDRLAFVNGPAPQPNSYVVTSHGAKYVRNRRHLLHVPEPPPNDQEEDFPLVTHTNAPLTSPATTTGLMIQPQAQVVGNNGDTNGKQAVVTRSGRLSRPNQYYRDFVMT